MHGVGLQNWQMCFREGGSGEERTCALSLPSLLPYVGRKCLALGCADRFAWPCVLNAGRSAAS